MKEIRKTLLAFLLVAVLPLAGCQTGDTSWVYEYSGERMPAGLYILYVIDGLNEALVKDREANEEIDGYESPRAKDLVKKEIEGVSGEEWIRNYALASAREYFWVEETFDRLQLSLSSTDEAEVRTILDSSYSDYYRDNGVGESSVEAYLRNVGKKAKIMEALYDDGGELALPDGELHGVFAEHYLKMDYFYLNKATADEEEDSDPEELNAEVKAKAEAYVQRLRDGEAIEQLIYEENLAINPEEVHKQITVPEKGQYTVMFSPDWEWEWIYSYSPDFVEQVQDLPAGEPALVETDTQYNVVYRYDLLEDEVAFQAKKSTVLYNYKAEEFDAYVSEQAKQIAVNVNQEAYERYQPAAIKERS